MDYLTEIEYCCDDLSNLRAVLNLVTERLDYALPRAATETEALIFATQFPAYLSALFLISEKLWKTTDDLEKARITLFEQLEDHHAD